MHKKKEMTKHERRQLERNIKRNIRQRKENRRDSNRLKSKYPAFYLLKRKPFIILCDEDEEMEVNNKTFKGIFA